MSIEDLVRHLRPEMFGSQLNRKSETWFFTFLNVYVS